MPLYLGWWQQEQTPAENLLHLIGSSGSPLLTEGRLIMETEIGSDQAGAVLYAIAAGASKYSEIKTAAGFDPLRALDRLQEARLITRAVPAGEEPHKSRRAIYRIADNFLAFYLGPVLRHRSEIERGRGRTVVVAIERELDSHLGLPHEEAFRECLWRKVSDGSLGLEDITEIGPWWGAAQSGDRTADRAQVEIDAVLLAQPAQTRIPVAVGEAKWGKTVNGSRLRARLTAKAASITPDVDQLRYIVCARSEVITPHGSDTIAITAHDIFPDPATPTRDHPALVLGPAMQAMRVSSRIGRLVTVSWKAPVPDWARPHAQDSRERPFPGVILRCPQCLVWSGCLLDASVPRFTTPCCGTTAMVVTAAPIFSFPSCCATG